MTSYLLLVVQYIVLLFQQWRGTTLGLLSWCWMEQTGSMSLSYFTWRFNQYVVLPFCHWTHSTV